MVRRTRWLALGLGLGLGACTGLDPSVLYRCEADGSCAQAGFSCQADGYCHPKGARDGGADSGVDGGLDAGTNDGGNGDGGTGDAGNDAGLDGGQDGGNDGGCVPLSACPGGLQCGFLDAGCGAELRCGVCPAPQECGVNQPFTCAPPRLCTAQGWCFENPLPQGYTIRAGWAADPHHAWWVGDNGLMLFWNGEHHSVVTLPSAVGTGVDLLGVDGTAPDDVYAVGTRGTLLHFDGTTWTAELSQLATLEFRAVLAQPSGNAVAVGRAGVLFRRLPGAMQWSSAPSAGAIDYNALAEEGGDVYAIGDPSGALVRENSPGANQWSQIDAAPVASAFSLWAEPSGALLLAGARLDDAGTRVGTVLRRQPDAGWSVVRDVAPDLHVVRGSGATALAAGDLGLLVRLADGATFTAGSEGWKALVVGGSEALLEGDDGQVGSFDLSSGGFVTRSAGSSRTVNAICGDDSDPPFAASQGTLGCTGASCTARVLDRVTDGGWWWTIVDQPIADTGELTACTSQTGFEYLTGDGSKYLQRISGSSMVGDLATNGLPPAHYTGVWQYDLLHVYFINRDAPSPLGTFAAQAVGPPASPTNVAAPFDGLGDLALAIGGAPGVGFAVGQNGLVLAFGLDGGLVAAPRLGAGDLTGISGASLDDGGTLVVVVGKDGGLFRLEGAASFTAEPQGTADFSAVWVAGSGDAWAAGVADAGARAQAAIYRRAPGAGWSKVPLDLGRSARTIFGATVDGGTTVWLGSGGGLILRKDD